MLRRRTRRGGRRYRTGVAYYDTERRQLGRSLVARARHLGAYLEAQQTQNEQERCQTHLTRDPEPYMRDYGADELIATLFGNPRDDQPVGLVESYRAG